MTVIKVILAVVLTSHITSSQRNSDEGINYENLRKFMSQTPAELEATLHLLENPFVAAALVNGDRAFRNQNARPTSTTPPTPPPQEETNNLLNFLLSQRGRPGPGSNSGNGYKITRPNDPLVPPSVDTRGILSDPLLGSFFMDNGEDQPPLEVRVIIVGCMGGIR